MIETQPRATFVRAETRDGVRILELNNPPVHALSFAVSGALLAEIESAEADDAVEAVIITGSNGTFSGGADINDFLTAPPNDAKSVRDVVAAIERSNKTYVAAIDGNALGGGLETALACDYRIAAPSAKVGLPEILLGLIPGAGGTQRLPRLLATKNPFNYGGVQMALQFMLEGKPKAAKPAKGMGIIDEIFEGDLLASAVEFAKAKAGSKNRISALS